MGGPWTLMMKTVAWGMTVVTVVVRRPVLELACLAPNLALPLMSCVALSKFPNLSDPQFPHLKQAVIRVPLTLGCSEQMRVIMSTILSTALGTEFFMAVSY